MTKPVVKKSSFASLNDKVDKDQVILPKVIIPEKPEEGFVDVEFLQNEPRDIEFQDKFDKGKKERKEKTPGYAINVKILNDSAKENDVGSIRSLVFRGDSGDGKPLHGLTRGINALAQRHEMNLKGVHAKISYSNYENKEFGTTRGYSVIEIESDAP